MLSDQPQGRRARNRPSVAEMNRRAEEPPRPRHPFLETGRHRLHHRQTQSLPQEQELQQRGEHLVQDDPNVYQDGHRRYHSSVIGRIGPHAPDNVSTLSLENYQGIPTRAQYVEPQYSGVQYPGWSQYPGSRYPGPQFPGPQFPGPLYPGPQYPGPQSTVSPQIHCLTSTYRPIFDEYGIPQVIDNIPHFQEVFGQSSSAFNDQIFAGPPESPAGIPNSMAPFDSTFFQQGHINAPYLLPAPGYGNYSQEEGVSRDPFQSLLSTPYLLPAPLPSSPTQQPAITQDSYQFPSSGTSHLAMTDGRTRSRAARSQGSNLHETQTTVNPRELNIVEHDLQGPLTQSAHHASTRNERNHRQTDEIHAGNINDSSHRSKDHQFPALYHSHNPQQDLSYSSGPAGQTPQFGKWHEARDLHASAVYDPQLDHPNPGSDQQLHTPTRQRVSHHQAGSRDSEGQDSGKRKRRAYSSPEAGSSPRTSSPMTSIAGRRQGENPKNGRRIYFHPQQEKQTPPEPDTSERQDQTRPLMKRQSSQSGIPLTSLDNDSGTGAMVDQETLNAATGIVSVEQQKPCRCVTCGKRYGTPKGLKAHHDRYCKREERQAKGNRRRAISSPEAGSSAVMTDHERTEEAIRLVPGKEVPHDGQNHNGNDEQQQEDDAQNPSILNQDSGTPSRPPQSLSAKKRRAQRKSSHTELDAYNGVIIPSKLEPGEAPVLTKRFNDQRPRNGRSKCPICGERFGQNSHLRQHFVACVRYNGNPDGHYWDDMLEDK